jgi:hypothetical protein
MRLCRQGRAPSEASQTSIAPCSSRERGAGPRRVPARGSLREKPPPESGERRDCVLTVARRVVAAAEFVE